MNIFELAASAGTVDLNTTLNPTIWTQHEHLRTAVRDQILIGAEEYCAYLGLTESQVNDIVISGDTASFQYSNQSTVDVVVIADLDPDPTFREFFNEHKYKYNGQQQVKIDRHLVQFYVQPADQQFVNNGSYSVLRESWVQIPKRTITEDTVSQLRALDLAARPRPQAPKKKRVVQEAITVKYGFGTDFLDEVGVTPDGVSASTCQFANEDDAPVSPEDTVQDFVKFCADQLGLEREPDLRIRRDPEWSRSARTFGRYNPGTNQLEVSLAGRHVMDILRTVAHELTHQHQHERESVPDHAGETGSEWENEANARAGILMRDYAQTNPHLFDAVDTLGEGWKNWAAAGMATAALAGGAGSAQAQSVQQGLGAVQNIGTAVNTFKGVNWNAMLRSEAGTALYNFILANGGNPNSQNQSTLYQWQKQMQQGSTAQPQAQPAQYTQQASPASATGSMYSDQLAQHNSRQGVNETAHDERFIQQLANGVSKYVDNIRKSRETSNKPMPVSLEPGSIGKITGITSNTDAEKYLTTVGLIFNKFPKGQLGGYRPAEGDWGADIGLDVRYLATPAELAKMKSFATEISKPNNVVSVSVAHELRHALDDYLSKGKYDSKSNSKDYWNQPHEINAYFTQALKGLQAQIDAGTVTASNLINAIKKEFKVNELDMQFPTGVEDPRYRKLLKRAYDYFASGQRQPVNEASGYIPTAAQADDPRFEMALTADVRPGATGKNANKLLLNTDAQGHPQQLRADGMVERMMAEYLEFKK